MRRFEKLLVFKEIVRIIRPITWLNLDNFFLGQVLLCVKLLVLSMRIPRFIVHRIVHIDTFMVKQFGEWNHCCVLKVFSKTSGYQMRLDPFYILQTKGLFVEILRVFYTYLHELFALLLKVHFLLHYSQFHPLVFHHVQFQFIPKNGIVDVFWKVSY